MTEHPKNIIAPTSGDPPTLEERLLEKYGHHLEGEELNDAQRKECLLSLWQIMSAFAEYGFSVKAGEKFTALSDHGMDDVLQYLILEDTAHETVAPSQSDQTKEQP